MARSTTEWIGSTDDARIPPRVKARILERENFTCHLTGLRIDPVRDKYDFDHKIALILGGRHAESNIFPALNSAHKQKTAAEVKVKAKIAAVRNKHIGVTVPKKSIQSAPFAKREKPHREPKQELTRRSLYRQEQT